MKINRLFSLMLTLATVFLLAACSNTSDSPNAQVKEGIAPYELSEKEKYLLQSFGMEDNAQILSIHAPEEATALHVNVYRLDENDNWITIGNGEVSTSPDSHEQMTGNFTMQLKENFAIDFNINLNGIFSYQTEEIILSTEPTTSTKSFLQEFQKIELNEEIPVALMVYDSSTAIGSYSLQDFFEPSTFKTADFVQAVTLTFTDEE